MIGCVAAGVGVTLLPKGVVAPAWREGRVAVHELPATEARVDTLFIRRKDVYANSALTAFLAMARPAPADALAAA
jgi:DNA-binding transcriptional LysR family regulator